MKTILLVLEAILSMLIASVITSVVALVLHTILYSGGLFIWCNYIFLIILKFIFDVFITFLLFVLNTVLAVTICIGFVAFFYQVYKLFKKEWYYDKSHY